MDMLGSASLVHAGLTDLSGLEGLGDHLSHHHHAAAAAHHHYYAQVSQSKTFNENWDSKRYLLELSWPI